jgi:hypothetical protein
VGYGPCKLGKVKIDRSLRPLPLWPVYNSQSLNQRISSNKIRNKKRNFFEDLDRTWLFVPSTVCTTTLLGPVCSKATPPFSLRARGYLISRCAPSWVRTEMTLSFDAASTKRSFIGNSLVWYSYRELALEKATKILVTFSSTPTSSFRLGPESRFSWRKKWMDRPIKARMLKSADSIMMLTSSSPISLYECILL